MKTSLVQICRSHAPHGQVCDTKRQGLEKRSFGVRPRGNVLARSSCNTPCKVLKLVADDFLNLQGTYDSTKARLEKTAHRHIQQHLLNKRVCEMRTLNTGDFIYKEGDPCDSVFIFLDGQVEVLNTKEGVGVEELYPGDYFPLTSKIDTRHSSVQCTQPVKVVEIGGEIFHIFLSSNKFLATYFREEVMAREKRRLDRLTTVS
ncbi:hypothetical protein PsorP6_005425 [Peronosclerospora sorghi]|uniref:Uncharacterized protein n=1 Tax=Peronosclerospora sorghi TaxID=230839 RepID=A0ACC0W656_9STRA|nr:hypothetical protein PsorP6_005425 [Peronosclerospora sorghi]